MPDKIMLIGEYRLSVDDKKRVVIPVDLRDELGKEVVVTRGLDSCLFVHPMVMWEEIVERLGKQPVGNAEARQFSRILLSAAVKVGVDTNGRILIPDHLKDYARLGKRIVIIGVYKRLEIWDEEAWQKYKDAAEAGENQEQIAAKLGEVGVY